MSRLTLFRVGFLFLILFFTTTAKAQKEAETFNVDSTLYEYYQRCQEYLLEPVVLNMSDTLFRMAGERQDERMQAVAIATQLDYYYFQGTNEDSVIHYTNKVKEFAKATHQPKYYYFAWAMISLILSGGLRRLCWNFFEKKNRSRRCRLN